MGKKKNKTAIETAAPKKGDNKHIISGEQIKGILGYIIKKFDPKYSEVLAITAYFEGLPLIPDTSEAEIPSDQA